MSSSATGTVFWGYDLGDMTDDEFEFIGPSWIEDDDEWEDIYAEAKGVEPVPFPRDAPRVLGRLDNSNPEVSAWLAWRDQVRSVVRAQPFEVGFYGHTEGETLRFVYARSSKTEATYECVRLGSMLVPPEWHGQLTEFMETLGLPVPTDQPGWFLTSDYG